jgi:hypothetical protein
LLQQNHIHKFRKGAGKILQTLKCGLFPSHLFNLWTCSKGEGLKRMSQAWQAQGARSSGLRVIKDGGQHSVRHL